MSSQADSVCSSLPRFTLVKCSVISTDCLKAVLESLLSFALSDVCARVILNWCVALREDLKIYIYFFHGARVSSGTGPPPYQGFTITLRRTTFGRTPLHE